MRVFRIVVIWIALMSGLFSLCREFYFAYLAANGRPVAPNNVLAVFGHLSIATFILSAGGAWFIERNRVKTLEGQHQTKPIYRVRSALIELDRKGHKLREKIEQNRWWLPMKPRIWKLRKQFSDILEIYVSPTEKIDLLDQEKDEFERARFMLDFTPKQLSFWDSLTPLLTGIDKAIRRIDMQRE